MLFSLTDRINFWDFGGHADYDEIRVELYGQTQVRVKLMSRKKISTIVIPDCIAISFC